MLKAAVVGGIVAGVTAAAVLLACTLVVYLVTAHAPPRVDRVHGVVIEGGPGGPTTTFTVSQLPTP